jgi:type I restriction enzyme, S subunit
MRRIAKLGDVCSFVGGGTPSRTQPEYYSGRIPWVTVKDFKTYRILDAEEHITADAVADSAANLVSPGTVLLVTRVGLGKVAIADTQLAINQDVKGLTPTEEVLPEYLFWFLLSKARYIVSIGVGATVKGITLHDVKAIEIPIPSLAEQRRTVDLLARAEGIVRLCREAQVKAQAIIPAQFLDMFGDPATNPKRWPVQSFESVGSLDRGRSRNRPRDAAELYGGPYPFIQTGDVANSGGRITAYTATYSELGLQQSKLWPPGTLCITIAANIAKTGVLTFEACFPDSVVGFLPGPNVTTPYIQGWLSFLQPTIEANAPQAAQKNINLEILRALPVPVPPIQLQELFRQHSDAICSVLDQQITAAMKADAAFAALLSRAFSGDPMASPQGVAAA